MSIDELERGLSHEQFEAVRPMLEAARRKTRPRKHDLYDVFRAILYFLHTGSAWRKLPPGLPPWRTVHEYFSQWTVPREGSPTLLEEALQEVGDAAAVARLQQLLARR